MSIITASPKTLIIDVPGKKKRQMSHASTMESTKRMIKMVNVAMMMTSIARYLSL